MATVKRLWKQAIGVLESIVATIGVGGIIAYKGIPMIVFLWWHRHDWSDDQRGEYCLKAIHDDWTPAIVRWLRAHVGVYGRENISESERYVFAFNHESAADAVLACLTVSHVCFVGKKEARKYPIIGQLFVLAGQIEVDRTNHEQCVASTDDMRKKRPHANIVVFAEGTRSKPGEMGQFKKGAAYEAIARGVRIVPVAFRGTGAMLGKGRLLGIRFNQRFTVSFGEPISTKGRTVDKLTEQVRKEVIALYEEAPH